jgi:transaldolase
MNRLRQLISHGQSIWLDFTRRNFVDSGELRKLIDEDGVTGVTSNPDIFDKALSAGDEYASDIAHAAKRGVPADEAFEEIAIADIQRVADELRPVYDRTQGADGYVSMEVSPHLAHDTEGSIRQGREYWGRIDRPNLFIKIPATNEGLPAIRHLIAEGINVNITLLFSLRRYRAVAESWLIGLEERLGRGGKIDRVASVASFFLSRIDLVVDPRLEEIGRGSPELAARAGALRGKAAIACAKQAYQIYKEIVGGDRFRKLAAAGARPQRVLWASTSTKRPEERDVRYVEALIGPDTINTVPLKTLEAFRDHGDPTPRLEQGLDDVHATLRSLGEIGIDLEAVGRQLEDEGVEKFNKPYDHLQAELGKKLGAKDAPAAKTKGQGLTS